MNTALKKFKKSLNTAFTNNSIAVKIVSTLESFFAIFKSELHLTKIGEVLQVSLSSIVAASLLMTEFIIATEKTGVVSAIIKITTLILIIFILLWFAANIYMKLSTLLPKRPTIATVLMSLFFLVVYFSLIFNMYRFVSTLSH